jgi:hypothetical protein
MKNNETLLQMAKRHQDDDMLRAGEYYDQLTGKGCSIGCFNHDLGNDPEDHEAFAEFAGIPVWAAKLQDRIFEGLQEQDRATWHVECIEAYQHVTDWDKTLDLFLISVLEGVKKHDRANVVQPVIDLLNRRLAGENVGKELKWATAAAAADADADSAAYAYFAADAAATAAAAAAADAAADAAAAAAYFADADAAYAADAIRVGYKQSRHSFLAAMKAS